MLGLLFGDCYYKKFPVAQHVKDLALLQLWHKLQLWYRFDPWPGDFHMPQALISPKKFYFPISIV